MYQNLTEFYKSKEWKRFRAVVIAERTAADGLIYDEYSGRPIIKAYDIVLHHKVPLTIDNVNDPMISLNPDNIMIVSHASHNELHNRFGLHQRRRVFIVHGSPLSGKTTFVQQAKGDRDIVVDIDRLWQAITMEPLYVKNNYLKTNVFEIRNALLDQIRTRTGQWETAWVIGGYPRRGERERLAERLGAELIHIDTDEAECMERLEQDTGRSAAWREYITNYFRDFS